MAQKKKIIIIGLICSILAACAPDTILVPKLANNPARTGAALKTKDIETPYTDTVASSALQTIKNNLSTDIKTNGIEDQSAKFVQSITKIEFRVNKTANKVNGITSSILIGSDKLNFDIPVQPDNSFKETMSGNYSLSGSCTDANCAEVSLYISHYDSSKKLDAKAGFVYRKMKASVQALLPDGQKNMSDVKLKTFYDQYKGSKEVEVDDIIIASGASTSKVTLLDGTDNLNLNISNVETNQVSPDVEVVDTANGVAAAKQDIQGTLLGNTGVANEENQDAPQAANNLILLQGKNGERIYATLDRYQAKPSSQPTQTPHKPEVQGPDVTDSDLKSLVASYFIPINKTSSRQVAITKGFERLRNTNVVKSTKKKFLASKKSMAQNFLNNIKSPLKLLQQMCDDTDVPCTVLYLMMQESGYLYSKLDQAVGPPVQVGTNCEVGPFQIKFATGMAVSTKLLHIAEPRIYPVQGQTNETGCQASGLSPNINDDRRYLEPAAKIAINLMDELFKQFSYEPAFAIMGYNQGHPVIARALRDLKSYGFEKIAGNYPMPGYQYATQFLAMYFVGADPEASGLDRNQTGYQFSCEEVYSPTQIKNGMCK